MRSAPFLRACVVAGIVGAVSVSTLVPAGAVMPAKAASPAAWATSVCTSVGDWVDTIERAAAKAVSTNTTTPKAAKKSLTKLLDQTLKATNTLVAKIKKAGPPDVADGPNLASILRQQYQQLTKSLKNASKSLQRASTSDSATFDAAARSVEDALESAFEQSQTAFNAAGMLDVEPLAKAFLAEPACEDITG